jgi:hypothetical protein
MAEWKRQATTTAELYEAAMSSTGEPPSADDTIDLRRRQAQLTHLALHRYIRLKPDSLLDFIKEVIDRNELVWTLWDRGEAGAGWDVIKGKAMLAAGIMPGSDKAGRYSEATVLVPDGLASQLLNASYGDGKRNSTGFGLRGAVLSISLPSERRNPSRYDVIAASEPL